MARVHRVVILAVWLVLLVVACVLYAKEQKDSGINGRYLISTSANGISPEPSSAIGVNLDDGALVFSLLDRPDTKGSVRHPVVYIHIGGEQWSLTGDELRLALQKLGARRDTLEGVRQ